MKVRTLLAFCITTLVVDAGFASKTTTTEFGMNYSNFVSGNQTYFGEDLKAKNLATAGLGLRMQTGQGSEESLVDVKTFFSFIEDRSYVNLKEAYYDFGRRGEDLVLGRKLYTWSVADEAWMTGLWQPQFAWDRARPEQQGIFGGFWAKRVSEKKNLKVFVSPIFVPDDRVRFRENNGRLESSNPWFRGPPPTGNVLNTETAIFNKIEYPEVGEVILNPGLGFRLDHSISEEKTLGFAYAYKPINQILNAFDYRLRAADVSGGVDLTFYPWVGYHNLLTTDWTHQDREYIHNLSATYESPTRLFRDPNLNYQQLKDSYVLSWLTRWNLKGEGSSATQVYGGYMRHFGGTESDGGDVISEGTQFESKNVFYSAFKLGLKYPVWTKARRLVNSIEMNYDVLLRGGVLLSQFEYVIGDAWVMNANIDLIGMVQKAEDAYKQNWINAYKANDKVSLGMTYVY